MDWNSVQTLRSLFMGCLLAGLSLAFLLFAVTLAEHVGLSHRLRALSSILRLFHRFRGKGLGSKERVPALLPSIAAAFLMGFGFVGVFSQNLLAALIGGGALLGFILLWLRRLTQSLGEPIKGEALLGATCTVTLTIPCGGVGSIAYTSQGKRHTMPARCQVSLPQGSQAIVTDVRAGIAVVETL